MFKKKSIQTLEQQAWIVRRLVYAWSLTEKPVKWEGKQLSAHVKQMMAAYDQLGDIIHTWINYDRHKENEQAHAYVVAAVCEWLHPNFDGTQSEPLDDLQRMIKGIITPVPMEEVKAAAKVRSGVSTAERKDTQEQLAEPHEFL